MAQGTATIVKLSISAFAIATFLLFRTALVSLLYHPRNYTGDLQAHYGAAALPKYEVLQYKIDAIKDIQTSYYVPPFASINQSEPHAQERIWFVCGGNRALAANWMPLIATATQNSFHQNDLPDKLSRTSYHAVHAHFFLFEYPGYGNSTGSLSESLSVESAYFAIRALADRLNVTRHDMRHRYRFGFIGHSLGASICTAVAASFKRDLELTASHRPLSVIARRNGSVFLDGEAFDTTRLGKYPHWLHLMPVFMVDKVVLISPFTSITEMAAYFSGSGVFALFKSTLFANHDYDTRASLAQLGRCTPFFLHADSQPVLRGLTLQPSMAVHLFHGAKDTLVPPFMSLSLLEQLQQYPQCAVATRRVFPNTGHNDILAPPIWYDIWHAMHEEPLSVPLTSPLLVT